MSINWQRNETMGESAEVKVAKRHPEFMRRVTMINDMSQRYFSTEICDVVKHVKLPEREHPFDQYSVKELDRCQS